MVVVILRLRASLFLAQVVGAPWSIAPHCMVILGTVWAAAGTVDALAVTGQADDGTVATLLATRGVQIVVIAFVGALLLPRPTWRLTIGDLRRFSLPRAHLALQNTIAAWGHPLVVIAGVSAIVASFRVHTSSTTLSIIAACCAWANLGTLVGVLQTFVERSRIWRRSFLAVATVGAIALLCAMTGVFRALFPSSESIAFAVAKFSPAGAPWLAISQPTTAPTLVLSLCYLGVLLGLQGILAGPAPAPDPILRSSRSSAFELMPWPDSRASAIVWRQYVYMRRDARRVIEAVAGLCLAAMATLFAAIVTDADAAVRVFVLSIVLLACSAPHNSSAMDGTTLWPDILAGVTGVAERTGRIILPAVLGLIASVAGCVVIQVGGRVDTRSLLAFGLTCLSLVACALSVATVLDAVLSYPPRRDETSRPVPPQLLREVVANTLALLLPLVGVLPAISEIVQRVPDVGVVLANFAVCLLVLALSLLLGGVFRRRTIARWFEQAESATFAAFPRKAKHVEDN